MNEVIDNTYFSPIYNYNYSNWFQDILPNGRILTELEKKQLIQVIDETVEQFSEPLPFLWEELTRIKDIHDEFHEIERVISSIYLFVLITSIDSMITSKYFMLADKDYDRRLMRGKLKVILNEGFKKLYGFKGKSISESEWSRLSPFMKQFPEVIKSQYEEISALLKQYSESSYWWKEERDLEVHLDAEMLYFSRKEDINESEVMLDCFKLFRVLSAVSAFLENANACILNTLLKNYHQGLIKE